MISFFVGLPWGVRGVAISYAIAWTLLMPVGFAIPFRLVGLSGLEFIKQLWPELKPSLLMAVIAASVARRLALAGVPSSRASTVQHGCRGSGFLYRRIDLVETTGTRRTELFAGAVKKLHSLCEWRAISEGTWLPGILSC